MTQEKIIDAISNAVAEFRKYIDSHDGDIDTPREDIIKNLKEFAEELDRRFGSHIRISDNGLWTNVDGIKIEYNPSAQFIRVEKNFISTSVGGGGENSASINNYIEDCMYIAFFGSEDILPTLDLMI